MNRCVARQYWIQKIIVNYLEANRPTETKKKSNIKMFNGPFSEIISGYSNTSSNYHSSRNIQVELSISELIKWNHTKAKQNAEEKGSNERIEKKTE